MSKNYIETHFEAICSHASAIEQRLDDSELSKEMLIRDNLRNLEQCKQYGCEYILIDGDYQIELT
jgi:hypothetical protein